MPDERIEDLEGEAEELRTELAEKNGLLEAFQKAADELVQPSRDCSYATWKRGVCLDDILDLLDAISQGVKPRLTN